MRNNIQGSDAMFKITYFICLVTLVCGQTPAPSRPKQFRYVDDDENNGKVATHRQEAAAPQQYVVPNTHPIAFQQLPPPEPGRPLVAVDTAAADTDKKVGVGVNVGPFYSMDLQTKREPTLGQKAVDLGLSVLGGLVRVNVQREGNRFTGRRGPILVQVGGQTVYSNGQK